jgi:hypothetical protein
LVSQPFFEKETRSKDASIVLLNGDLAEISRFVIYHKDHKSCVRRVEEILIEVDTETVLGILISPCVIGPDILPYRMPSCTVQLDQHKMVAFKVSDFSFL